MGALNFYLLYSEYVQETKPVEETIPETVFSPTVTPQSSPQSNVRKPSFAARSMTGQKRTIVASPEKNNNIRKSFKSFITNKNIIITDINFKEVEYRTIDDSDSNKNVNKMINILKSYIIST